MKDLGGLMAQAKKMQEAMEQAQEEIQAMEVEGTAGGGMVKVTLAGKGEMRSVSIDPNLLVPGEGEVLEDLIAAAFNDAKRRLDEAANKRMGEVTGPLASMMPPGFKPPFGG